MASCSEEAKEDSEAVTYPEEAKEDSETVTRPEEAKEDSETVTCPEETKEDSETATCPEEAKEDSDTVTYPEDAKEDSEMVTVNPLCNNPTRLWKSLSKLSICEQVKSVSFNEPNPENHIRFVCISDTHSKTEGLDLPDGDILLHAGDFTTKGRLSEIREFNNFLRTVKHKYKQIVVIAGNHELTLDEEFYRLYKNNRLLRLKVFGILEFYQNSEVDVKQMKKELLKNCIYLEDEEVNVLGFRIYGSPWQPEHKGMGFNLPRGERCLEKWNKIPKRIDVLLTHGPPLGYGDSLFGDRRAGCSELLSTVQKRVKPRVHVFGHIHEGYGITTDGVTLFINASTCNRRYQPVNKPIIFDLPVPETEKS